MSPPLKPADWLRERGAQADVIHGLARFESWSALWEGCPRGDWLLGIAERLRVPHVPLVRAAIGCARVALAEGDDVAARHLVDVAERWADGAATDAEVEAATKTVEVAIRVAVDPASEARSRAALAVGMGVKDRDVLSGAAAAAAESVIMGAIDCGLELAMRWAHDKCAGAVRAAISWDLVVPCLPRPPGPD